MQSTEETIGVAGHVARDLMSFALVTDQGSIRSDTIRSFRKEEQPTVSGGLSTFLDASGVTGGATRASLAVAGVARGDVISITNSPWFVSRSGLRAMLGEPPIILNDFAARAWALTGAAGVAVSPLSGSAAPTPRGEGTFCLIGLDIELGVAAFVRSSTGQMAVLSSEAGASTLPQADLPDASLTRLKGLGARAEAYTVLSGPGLVRLAGDLGGRRTIVGVPKMTDVRGVTNARDQPAQEAVRIFCDLFWDFAVNLVLTYGAWDGLILTGEIAELLEAQLAGSARTRFARKGSHARLLRDLPIGLASIPRGELAGASMALRSEMPFL